MGSVDEMMRPARESHRYPRCSEVGEAEASPASLHVDDRHGPVLQIDSSQDQVRDRDRGNHAYLAFGTPI
jgi:hypothetical protein